MEVTPPPIEDKSKTESQADLISAMQGFESILRGELPAPGSAGDIYYRGLYEQTEFKRERDAARAASTGETASDTDDSGFAEWLLVSLDQHLDRRG